MSISPEGPTNWGSWVPLQDARTQPPPTHPWGATPPIVHDLRCRLAGSIVAPKGGIRRTSGLQVFRRPGLSDGVVVRGSSLGKSSSPRTLRPGEGDGVAVR